MALTEVDAARLNDNVFNTVGPFKNRIINGDMRIDQRNAGASVTPANNDYTLDRWQVTVSQSSKFTVQQSTTAPVGFTNSQKVTSSSAYSVGASDYFALRQRIEGFNCADLAWGTASAATVTLSFRVYSSLTGTFGGSIGNSAWDRSYPFSYTISSANTWTTISITIPGDTSGTWLTNNGIGIQVVFGLGVGSTYSGTAGAWSGSLLISATGATSVVGTNGATFYITGVQLEAGSVATPFERRQYTTELQLCQRYFQLSDSVWGVATSATNVGGTTQFVVPMRSSPSIALQTVGAFNVLGITDFYTADYTQSSASVNIVNGNRRSTTGLCFGYPNFSGLTTGRYYGTKPSETAYTAFSAEL